MTEPNMSDERLARLEEAVKNLATQSTKEHGQDKDRDHLRVQTSERVRALEVHFEHAIRELGQQSSKLDSIGKRSGWAIMAHIAQGLGLIVALQQLGVFK